MTYPKSNTKSEIIVVGAAEVAVELQRFGERMVRGSVKITREAAKNIESKAKEYVPEDSEELKKSIRTLDDRGGFRGRTRFEIVAGGRTVEQHQSKRTYKTAFGLKKKRAPRKDVDLDSYAIFVHENYEDFAIEPSDKTKAKPLYAEGKVGSGFLRRAADEEKEAMEKQLFNLVTDLTRGEANKYFRNQKS